jgi:TM2 domain-containing membrane protein YozV
MAESTCPYCRSALETDDDIVTCSGCATIHHADCLAENGGCTVFGCSQAPAEEPKISVSGFDVTTAVMDAGMTQPSPPAALPASFLNLSTPPEPPPAPVTRIPTPPPPRPTGATPPPPPPVAGALHTSQQPVITYPTFAGYAPQPQLPAAGYIPRKSRIVFVLLAIFLGSFGGHNFYAGYVKKAVIQLCITVFSCFIGSFISWIWAIVEACIIEQDDDGVAFV